MRNLSFLMQWVWFSSRVQILSHMRMAVTAWARVEAFFGIYSQQQGWGVDGGGWGGCE